VAPMNLQPRWRNERMGKDRISKRLDMFLVSGGVIFDTGRIIQWFMITSALTTC
jgi:hypothetical protein